MTRAYQCTVALCSSDQSANMYEACQAWLRPITCRCQPQVMELGLLLYSFFLFLFLSFFLSFLSNITEKERLWEERAEGGSKQERKKQFAMYGI